MGVLDYFYASSPVADSGADTGAKTEKANEDAKTPSTQPTESALLPEDAAKPSSSAVPVSPTSPKDKLPPTPPAKDEIPLPESTDRPAQRNRRFSFRSLAFIATPAPHASTLSPNEDHDKRVKAHAALTKRRAKPPRIANSDKRAKASALVVRDLIVGPSPTTPPSKSGKSIPKPELKKIKAQLMQPKSANKVIAQLRALPVADIVEGTIDEKGRPVEAKAAGPIHAVCLEWTEEEADEHHFCKHLTKDGEADGEVIEGQVVTQAAYLPSVATANISSLTNLFRDLQIVSLISAPDLGLGQPGDGEGILSGAVPTAETIIRGVQQVTPQLMALGYATGQAMMPDHKGTNAASPFQYYLNV